MDPQRVPNQTRQKVAKAFSGPSNRLYYTGGDTSGVEDFLVKTSLHTTSDGEDNYTSSENDSDNDDWKTLVGEGWYEYMNEPMGLRPCPGILVAKWARMGMWRKRPFSLLQGMAARLPDFAVSAWMRDLSSGAHQCAIAIEMGKVKEVLYSYEALSKNKAKTDVSIKALNELDIFGWLDEEHEGTTCDEYLIQG